MEYNTEKYSIEVPDTDPFKNCKLDRKDFAENLTTLLKNSSETSLTLALDGGWGMGKTTFLSMLRKYLLLRNIPTIYFSAWESDYTNEPLLAIIAEFNKQLSEQTTALQDRGLKTKIKNRMIKASALILPTLGKSVVSMILTKLGTDKVIGDAVKEVMEDTRSWGKELLKSYEENTQNVRNFKENLHEVVQLLSEINRKPIVVIIDELDRCKPSYSIQVLEIVKHFFDIEGITFILSADYTQLKASINHCYGVNFDADTYTHKFFDFYFTLDIKNSQEALINYIFEQHWSRHMKAGIVSQSTSVVLDYCEKNQLSIRDIQQIANMCKLIYISCGEYMYKNYLIFIVYYIIEKHKNGKFYKLLSEISEPKSENTCIPLNRVDGIIQSITLTQLYSHVRYCTSIFLLGNTDLQAAKPNITESERIWNHFSSIIHSDSNGRYLLYSKLMKVLSFLDYTKNS